MVLFVGLYTVAATLLVFVLRMKNAAVPPAVQRMEDAEQMAAVGRGLVPPRVERDPYATLS